MLKHIQRVTILRSGVAQKPSVGLAHFPTVATNIGCGGGIWTNELAKRARHTVGIDVSAADVRKAAWRAQLLESPAGFVLADAQSLPFRSESFDECMAICVFEHIRDDDRAFQEAWRVLKPGGRFILSVPTPRLPFVLRAMASMPPHLRRVMGSAVFRDSTDKATLMERLDARFRHHRRYDERLLACKAKSSGFDIEELRYNLKALGNLINGIIHSLRILEIGRDGERTTGDFINTMLFPITYPLHRMDDVIPVKGCTIVARLRKQRRVSSTQESALLSQLRSEPLRETDGEYS